MTLQQASILVVDDEPVLRMTFGLVLQRQGATVHTASDGVEALEILAAKRVDLMLTDKQMPRMDGITLLNTLVQSGQQTPSVLFVNAVEAESPTEMDRLGVVEMVTKPVHPERLINVLSRVLDTLPAPA